jgi:hypothetical protein
MHATAKELLSLVQQTGGSKVKKATFLQQSAAKCACTSLSEAIEKTRSRWLNLFIGE